MPLNSMFFYLFLFSSLATTNGGGGDGFTTSLFHRDTLFPTLHLPSPSRYERLTNAFRRSFSRYATLLDHSTTVSTTGIHTPLIPNNEDGEYVMSISMGTPPIKFFAIADTGSDLTWTQCMPCINCFNQSTPLFNPRNSSSYRPVPCTSTTCRSISISPCMPHHPSCTYNYNYADQSFTNGDLAFEKLTIGSFKLHNTIIGCGHQNGGIFKGRTSGIIGLGTGSISLVSQMRKIANLKRRFSYCLPTFFSDSNVTGRINFGRNAVVSGRKGHKVVSTPLVLKFPSPFYFLTLEAISIANKRLEAANVSSALERGNIIIDSGTTLTFLPRNLYNAVISTLASVVRAKRVEDPLGILELCYVAAKVDDLDIPIITTHFSGGAAVKLLPLNTFVTVADNVTCLSFKSSSDDDLNIFGNLAQVNFLIGYDLERKRLSFKHKVCA
ncbi:aspartic proteinase CDR1-like [Cucurbita moschata]|uniref:Aspartic proteinase CDR1-like n=1 Tax=Cucurbita moschata TaxID=3662 RepID=A0A6J1HHU3_CUCMO|nr:aspartic proteinase CDR1-like [Cucurbita moschata]